jgi:deazaflavin-dependent oxidoreductase (nitroreductase family)
LSRNTGQVTNASPIAARLAPHVDDDFCYLTTRGRVTGKPHEIEIWFALDTEQPTTLFLMAGGGDGSDWVRNLRVEPAVTVRVGDTTYAARARVVDPASDEDERARTLVHDKFAPRYSDDLTEWRGRALPVAVDVVDTQS